MTTNTSEASNNVGLSYHELLNISESVIWTSWFTIIVSSVIMTTLGAAFTVGTGFYVGIMGNPVLDVVLYLVPLWFVMHGLLYTRHGYPVLSMTAAVLLGVLFLGLTQTAGAVVDSYLNILITNEYGSWLTTYPGDVEIIRQYGNLRDATGMLGTGSLLGFVLHEYSPRDILRVIR